LGQRTPLIGAGSTADLQASLMFDAVAFKTGAKEAPRGANLRHAYGAIRSIDLGARRRNRWYRGLLPMGTLWWRHGFLAFFIIISMPWWIFIKMNRIWTACSLCI